MKRFVAAAISVCFTVLLFLFPEQTFDGIADGVILCKDTLLPSLFPFMIISSFLSFSGAFKVISMLFLPIIKIFSLPYPTGGIWLSCFIGGFPSGAASVCSLYDSGSLNLNEAEKLLSCCVCSGPAFLILAVGRNMMGSIYYGAILFISQIISVIALTLLLCRSKCGLAASKQVNMSFSTAFVASVNKASTSMLGIFGFVTAFSAITEIFTSALAIFKPLCPLLEVTLGCKILSQTHTSSIIPIAFISGFGGLSVCFQVLSLAHASGIYPRYFWTVRLLNGLLCTIISCILLWIFPQAQNVYLSSSGSLPFAVWSVNSILGAVCFGAMMISALQKLDIYRDRFM